MEFESMQVDDPACTGYQVSSTPRGFKNPNKNNFQMSDTDKELEK